MTAFAGMTFSLVTTLVPDLRNRHLVRDPPRCASLSPRLRPPVSHRWLSRVSDGLADPLWALGAARAQADTRPSPQAALDAAAPVTVCASCEVLPAPTPRGRQAPRGLRHDGARPAGPGGLWLADQHRLCGAAELGHTSAGGGGGPSG